MKIKQTLQVFDVDYSSFYLDELENGNYMVSKDETKFRIFNEFEPAEYYFKKLAEHYNSEIEICK